MKEFGKSIIYGGLDGIITTFAVVSGSLGGNLGYKVILILGISNLIADGFSMAAGDYLSSLTEGSSKREAWANGFVTGISFNVFGSIPLLAYVLTRTANVFVIAGYVSLALVMLGFVKSKLTGNKPSKEIVQTLLVGFVAAFVAYGIGFIVSNHVI